MPSHLLPRRLLCAAILAALGINPAYAVKPDAPTTARTAVCPVPPPPAAPVSTLPDEDTRDGRAHVAADRAEARLNESAVFQGNVELRYGALRLFADQLTYDQIQNSLSAQGNIFLQKRGGETILAPNLNYELDTDRGQAEDARFTLAGSLGRGSAGQMRLEGRDVLELEAVRYTTCPPGRDDWMLSASSLTLDKGNDVGTATHAVIQFMHVPIFYTPYLSFPLSEERKTGFLGPHIGHTTQSGFVLDVPYYINLAPNYDDTVTARVLSERGLQLLNEFRYLGSNYSGKFDFAYLPDDRETNDDRELAFLRHSHSLSPRWSLSTDLQWVSDSRYFIDLATSPSESSRTHLPRDVRIDYGGSIWRFAGRASTFQTLDNTIPLTEQPYQRLPQLLLSANAPGGANRPHYALESEWVNFYRQGSTTQNSVTGQRLDIQPSLSLPLRTAYFYFTPKAGYRYTAWQLDNSNGADSTGATGQRNPDPERGLPVYSVDTGLALEREGSLRGSAYIQTLEPRLFYVRIPYENQDSLPVFDAAVPDFSFYNFFRENRFVGADRVGDTDQVTLAITSRFLDRDSGVEQVRIGLGQVHYLENQRVNLPPGPVSLTSSDLIGEVYARLGPSWYTRAGLQWDNKLRETRKASAYLHHRPQPDRIVNLGYRFLDTTTSTQDEQTDISVQWPLSTRWTGLARWNYSLPDSRTIQAYAGLEYASCCWALRVTGRHRLLPDGTEDNSVLFEFELSGLAKLGQTEETPLRLGQPVFE